MRVLSRCVVALLLTVAGCSSGGTEGDGESSYALSTPKVAWKAELPDTSCDLWHPEIEIAADGTVYVVQDSVLTAYKASGAVKWSTESGWDLRGMVVGNGVVYAIANVGSTGLHRLFAFDAATGKDTVLYAESGIPGGPTFTQIHARSDGRIEFGPGGGNAFVFDPATKAVTPTGRVDGIPLADGGHLFSAIDPNGGPTKLEKRDATGALVWSLPNMVAQGVSGPTGTIYAFDYSNGWLYTPELVGLDPATGNVEWTSGYKYHLNLQHILVLPDGSAVLLHDVKRPNAIDTWDATLERRSATGAVMYTTTIADVFGTPTERARDIYEMASGGSTVYVSGERIFRAYDNAGQVAWSLDDAPVSGPTSPIFPRVLAVAPNHTIYGMTPRYLFESQPQTPACDKGELMKLH